MGEVFAYTALDWETDVFLDDELIARERYRLAPESESVGALRAQFATGYYASCFVISPRLDAQSPCWPAIHDLHEEEAWIGCSALRRGGWVIKVLASGSVVLRRKLAGIRRELYAALDRREPSLRRGNFG
jgi:urease accessory protein